MKLRILTLFICLVSFYPVSSQSQSYTITFDNDATNPIIYNLDSLNSNRPITITGKIRDDNTNSNVLQPIMAQLDKNLYLTDVNKSYISANISFDDYNTNGAFKATIRNTEINFYSKWYI